MKSLLIVPLIFLSPIIFGQKNVLYKSKYQTIFIDDEGNSKFKKEKSNFSFDDFDKTTFENSLKTIINNKIILKNFDIGSLPKKWIELFQYKGQFYTYYYCDFCGDYKLEFKKNMIVETNCEGPNVIAVSYFHKINSKTFELKTFNESNESTKTIIHIIDFKKGVAVFEKLIGKESSYQLMLDVSKINQFPMIINNCPISKQSEFKEFETPNFKELLFQK